MELDEADLVAVDSEPIARALPLPTLPPFRVARTTVSPGRVRTRTLTPRRIVDEDLEEVVAGECLATIASLTDSSSHVRTAARRPSATTLPPPFAARTPLEQDALTAPRVPLPPGLPAGPPAAFVRRSSPAMASSVVSSSVSPVTAEPTVIVVRGRPRAAWVFGAAALGAFCAAIAGRLLTAPPAPPEPAVVVAAPAAPPPPPSEIVAPVASGAVALPPFVPKTPTVVSFADDQGVAIKAPTRPVAPAHVAAPVKAPAAASVKSSNVLPDGSLALGASAVSAPAARPTPPPPPPAPEPPKKQRAMTPEQQLADAQLKASMR